jgi:hypothetical protein
LVLGMISNTIEEVLSWWECTKLYDVIQETILARFDELMTAERNDINKHLDRIHANPTTYNGDFEAIRASHLKRLLVQRYPRESGEHAKAVSQQAKTSLVPLAILFNEAKDADVQWTNERLAEDKFGSMISCVATIHTYHNILSSNLADMISMQLKFDVLAKLRGETATMLRDGLEVFDTAHCAELLAEDPAREEERKQLLAEKAKAGEGCGDCQKLAAHGVRRIACHQESLESMLAMEVSTCRELCFLGECM